MTIPFDLSGSTVTVFGGSGFLGRHLVQHLARRGAVITVAVRRPDRAQFLRSSGDVGQIVPVAADVTDEAEVRAAAANADAVVNLVGILFPSKKCSFEAIHCEAAGRIAEAAKRAGAKRLVHVSALGVAKNSDSEYARTKARGEDAVVKAFPEATIVRPSVIFGPEDNFFNLFAAIARLSPVLPVMGASPELVRTPGALPKLELFGRGGPRLQPVYVGDVAEAIAVALESEHAQGKRYDLGGPRVYTMKEIVELVLRETGRSCLLVPAPFAFLEIKAAALELLGLRIITRDQVRLLRRDNVVPRKSLGFADLGITPATAEIILPTYLARYRRGGSRS